MYRWRRIIGIVVLWLDKCYQTVATYPLPLLGIPYRNTAAKAASQWHCLSSPREHTTRVRLIFIEWRVESLHKSLLLHYEVRQSKLAMSSAHTIATFAFNSGGFSQVQSARHHSKPEAVTAAVLLVCAALPQWTKTSFSRAVEMAPFRRNQLLKICNKTKDWL